MALTSEGLDGLIQRLRRIETDLVPALAAAVYQRAQRVMTASRPEVPVRNRWGGTLRASGMVLPPEITGAQIAVTFGYGGAAARYAAAVHENPRAGHTGGVSPSGHKYTAWSEVGKYHFLSDPMKEVMATYPADMAATVRDILQRHTRP